MIKEYENNRIKLINEIYTRSYTKNYLLKESFDDSLDYIACRIKKEIGNYYTIQGKKSSEQRSVTKCFVRKLNEKHWYPFFKNLVNIISIEIECFNLEKFIEEECIYDFINQSDYVGIGARKKLSEYEYKRLDIIIKSGTIDIKSYIKSDEETQCKYFSRLYGNRDFFKAILHLNILSLGELSLYDLRLINEVYEECVNIANENIKGDKYFILKILNTALTDNEIDYTLDDKQIVKYINQRISWLFGNRRRELPTWKAYIKKNSTTHINLNRHMHMLQKWFGFGCGMSNSEILELKHLTKSQREFIVLCLDNKYELDIKVNKKHEWDLSKKQLSDIIGYSLTAIDKKCLRIREKNKANGIEPISYSNDYSQANKRKFIPKDFKILKESMYISEDEKAEFRDMIEKDRLEHKRSGDDYFESKGNVLNYNYNTSYKPKRTKKEDMISFEEEKNIVESKVTKKIEHEEEYEEELSDIEEYENNRELEEEELSEEQEYANDYYANYCEYDSNY